MEPEGDEAMPNGDSHDYRSTVERVQDLQDNHNKLSRKNGEQRERIVELESIIAALKTAITQIEETQND